MISDELYLQLCGLVRSGQRAQKAVDEMIKTFEDASVAIAPERVWTGDGMETVSVVKADE